jgi:hypothetical protein
MEPETKDDYLQTLRCILCKETIGQSPFTRLDVCCTTCWNDLPDGPDFEAEDIKEDFKERLASVRT